MTKSKLNENILQFLLDNGFKLKEYEDQGLTFYSKEIKDDQTLKRLIEHHYELDEDEEINTKGVSFTVEIQTNGESPQWVFTGRHELFGILEGQQQFFEYVKEIKPLIS